MQLLIGVKVLQNILIKNMPAQLKYYLRFEKCFSNLSKYEVPKCSTMVCLPIDKPKTCCKYFPNKSNYKSCYHFHVSNCVKVSPCDLTHFFLI